MATCFGRMGANGEWLNRFAITRCARGVLFVIVEFGGGLWCDGAQFLGNSLLRYPRQLLFYFVTSVIKAGTSPRVLEINYAAFDKRSALFIDTKCIGALAITIYFCCLCPLIAFFMHDAGRIAQKPTKFSCSCRQPCVKSAQKNKHQSKSE